MTRNSSQAQLPAAFLSRLGSIYPPEIARSMERTFVDRPTSFRCNTLKTSVDEVLDLLKREGITVRRLNWSREGFLLTNSSQRELRKLPIYLDGRIYLQSLASMVPVIALAPKPNERVLDMTAAPGSKTSQIAALMRNQGSLHACELNGLRFQRLAHNMKLLGVDEASGFLSLRQGDAGNIYGAADKLESFDKILLDAPCSAEARIVSKDRRSHSFWAEDAIHEQATTQKRLLTSAWRALRPGGTLVYSTCTFAPEENEAQISQFVVANRDAKVESIPPLTGIKMLPGLQRWLGVALDPQVRSCGRIVPTNEIEGFFIAKLVKRI